MRSSANEMNGAGRIICERYALYFDHTKVTDEQAIDSLRDLLPLLTKILKCVVSVFFVNGDPMLNRRFVYIREV